TAGPEERYAQGELAERLDRIELPGVEIHVRPVKEHRFVLLLRGKGLSDALSETDPQQVGRHPFAVRPLSPEAARTAERVNAFVSEARQVLRDQPQANMVLLRGFARHPNLPTYRDLYGLRAAAVAVYPMYRGLAKLAGMETLKTGTTVADEFRTLEQHYPSYDFFFFHVKGTDAAGEDGDFDQKVRIIEEVDTRLPALLKLDPDVIVVTGDHSTPAVLRAHSWHPVPVLLYSRTCRPDGVPEFSERACAGGGLGHLLGKELMPLALANAGRLTKFGA
ncbi:MAG: phosphoglycerate mutase, partial [Candidatus Methylomirabilales bacterium]